MAHGKLISFSDSSVNALRRVLTPYRDETPIVGGRRRTTPARAPSPYTGFFIVSDTTSYDGEAPVYQMSVTQGLIQVGRIFKFVDAAVDIALPEAFYDVDPGTGYLCLTVSLSEAGVITSEYEVLSGANLETTLSLRQGRIVIATVYAIENEETGLGVLTIKQQQYGMAYVHVMEACEEEGSA